MNTFGAQFRPCIDLHGGKVKQIVGSTLSDSEENLSTNFVASFSPAYYAKLYQKHNLTGGHVIQLGPGNTQAAKEALAAWPKGLQIGGGINDSNAQEWLACGAAQVIVTSFIFSDGKFCEENLMKLCSKVKKSELVLDLSCRKKDNKYYNGIIGLGVVDKAKTVMYKFGESNRYYKRHLVPIGEYLPLGDLVRAIGPIFNMPMNYFSHGAEKQPNIQSQGLNIASAICYEIIFNSELSTQINENTNIIATISNDGWFNGTNGPHQHLSIARMRAKEFGKPVMRATNNGITAVIDYNGNIISELPQNVTSSLKTVLRPTKGITPFCIYGKTPMIILCTLLLIYTFYTNRKLKKQNKIS